MPRYIDADEVRDEILHDPDYDNDTINHFLSVIDDALTVGTTSAVDAVPVVRCEKCKHYRNYDNGAHPEGGDCDWHGSLVDADDFCSYGERKEDKNENQN